MHKGTVWHSTVPRCRTLFLYSYPNWALHEISNKKNFSKKKRALASIDTSLCPSLYEAPWQPLLMPSDLQSVEKHLSARPHELLLRERRKLVFLVSGCVGSLSKYIQGGVSRFSRHPDTGNCRPDFFDPTRANTIQTPDRIKQNVFPDPIPDRNHIHLIRIEKVPTVKFCNQAPQKAGSTPWQILERTPTHSEASKTYFFNIISGARVHHANVLMKGTFSTDCESDGIRTTAVVWDTCVGKILPTFSFLS